MVPGDLVCVVDTSGAFSWYESTHPKPLIFITWHENGIDGWARCLSSDGTVKVIHCDFLCKFPKRKMERNENR
jgi:hypothetical protein